MLLETGAIMRTSVVVACLTLTLATPAAADALFDAFIGCKDRSFREASTAEKNGWDKKAVNMIFVEGTRECMESFGYRFTCLRADGPIPGSEVMASCYDRR